MSEFSRIIGHRKTIELGELRAPNAQERAWVRAMAPTLTCVPKGLFRYRNMQEANADWERWQIDAIKAGMPNIVDADKASP
jgi:hypothetical protein